jgi:hypothetical protein
MLGVYGLVVSVGDFHVSPRGSFASGAASGPSDLQGTQLAAVSRRDLSPLAVCHRTATKLPRMFTLGNKRRCELVHPNRDRRCGGRAGRQSRLARKVGRIIRTARAQRADGAMTPGRRVSRRQLREHWIQLERLPALLVAAAGESEVIRTGGNEMRLANSEAALIILSRVGSFGCGSAESR